MPRHIIPILALAATLIAATAVRAQPRGCFATVDALAGTVEFQTRDQETWRPVHIGQCIYEAYGLRTAPRSGAILVLDDLSEITISENSFMYFIDVTERFLMSRLSGISLLSGEVYFDLFEGYDQIMIETHASALQLKGAEADIMVRTDFAEDTSGATGTTVFVFDGAVDVYDMYIMHRVTVGAGQQTNVERPRPPQEVFFFNPEPIKKYIAYWQGRFERGRHVQYLYDDPSLDKMRQTILGCPKGLYKKGLMCCPEACAQGPSSVPPDIFCPDGTYFIGARQCCDNACM